jgi:hypothetical protein
MDKLPEVADKSMITRLHPSKLPLLFRDTVAEKEHGKMTKRKQKVVDGSLFVLVSPKFISHSISSLKSKPMGPVYSLFSLQYCYTMTSDSPSPAAILLSR